MAKSTLIIGQELHSDSLIYRIEAVLGQGSFGITYKAKAFTVIKGKFGEELVETNTPKAIKEFFMKEVNERDESGSITGMSEGGLSYNYAQKFKREAENLASMNHPNIVKVIDFISANNTYYYVMDFIEGENLNDYLKHHKMSEKEATDTILEVAKALTYMHEDKHMLHLDLKPGNIMRRASDGHIFLIDFGLSKHYNEDGVPETSTSVGLGTPGYAPIEQANSKNAKKFRETLDVYALGATFFKLLTGQTPPYADEMLPRGDVAKSELSKYGIADTLISAVIQAMYPIADERTQNVKEFMDSLNGNSINVDVITSSAVNENTIIDIPEKKNSETKKKSSTKPKEVKLKEEPKSPRKPKAKSGKTDKLSNSKKRTVLDDGTVLIDTENVTNDNSEENSISGCLIPVLIMVVTFLFVTWLFNWWPFSPKEENANSSQVEHIVSSQDNNGEVTDDIITNSNSTGQIAESNSSLTNSVSKTEEVIEKNGYIKNGDGTITDTKHNLMWMSEDYVSIEGHSIPNASWNKAMEWCDKMNKNKYAGYSDWRVPTVKELISLARPASQRQFYKSFFGGSRTDYFWSCNSVSSAVKSYVCMDDGAATSGESEGHGLTYGGTKLDDFSVRLVRNIK